MAVIAVIGGTGADLFPVTDLREEPLARTEWGQPSAPLKRGRKSGHELVFLTRHGAEGNIPPHRVNYRANIAALHAVGADYIISLNAVGGIAAAAEPGQLVIPEQLIDYTWGREHSRYGDDNVALKTEYIDFTKPYDDFLRESLIKAAADSGIAVGAGGTYGVTQGPRLETAAEIDRLERDGCTIVGMTSMPEAALAREYGLRYASCSIVGNRAAGRSTEAIHSEIDTYLSAGMESAAALLEQFIRQI